MWRDDADGLTPYILVDDTAIRGKPYLTSFNVITLTELGDAYRFFIKAFNDIGSVTSEVSSIILAAVPDTPPLIITQVFDESSGS